MPVKVREKVGSGVGAQIDFETDKGEWICTLTFLDRNDWDLTKSTQIDLFKWDIFAEALALARADYPDG